MNKSVFFGLVGTVVLGAALWLAQTGQDDGAAAYQPRKAESSTADEGAKGSANYFHRLRANQVSGKVETEDVRRAISQAQQSKLQKKAQIGLQWDLMGPNDIGGRTRAFIFDQDDPKTMYMGSVSGGLFKSTNGGRSWEALDVDLENQAIVSLHQTADGTIYAGTGEDLYYRASGTGSQGILGAGIFKSTDDGNTWTQIPSTVPAGNGRGTWTAVGKIFSDPNDANRVYAATPSGLQISDDGGDSWTRGTINAETTDMTVTSSGAVYAKVGSRIFKSTSGDPGSFNEISVGGSPNADELPRNTGRGRIAVSPEDDNFVYVVYVDGSERFFKAYQSKDGGNSWSVIGERSILLNPHRNQGDFNNALVVDPKDKNRIIIGGVELWEWSEQNGWQEIATTVRFVPRFYVHSDKHELKFHPTKKSTLFAASDGGLFQSSDDGFTWTMRNKGYSTIQFYGIDVGLNNELMGGTQDNSNIYIDPNDILPKSGERLFSGDGGYAKLSKLNPKVRFLASQYGNLARTVDDGENFTSFFSNDVLGNRGNQRGVSRAFADFVTPFDLHEELRDPDSEDSIRIGADTIETSIGFGNGGSTYNNSFSKPQSSTKFVPESFTVRAGNQVLTSDASGNLSGDGTGSFDPSTGSFTVNFDSGTNLEIFITAVARYDAGAVVNVTSATNELPIRDTIPRALEPGDEYFVIDPVQSIFAVGLTAYDNGSEPDNFSGGVWMTRKALSNEVGTPEWWHVGRLSAGETPTTLEISPDGDMIYLGTNFGRVIRIGNLDNARSEETADIDTEYGLGNPKPSNSVVTEDVVFSTSNRAITGINFDQENPDRVIITLGNYGNSDFVYYTDQGKNPNLSTGQFRNVTGDLPPFPAYDGVFNYTSSGAVNNQVVLGTDYGIFTTDDITANSVSWTQENEGMLNVPVFDLLQQRTIRHDLKTNEDFEGAIYAGTHGRGIFKTATTARFIGTEELPSVDIDAKERLQIYPNPASGDVNFELNLANNSDVTILIRDINGREVLRSAVEDVSSTQDKVQTNVAKLQPGVYIVTVSGDGFKRTGRLLKTDN